MRCTGKCAANAEGKARVAARTISTVLAFSLRGNLGDCRTLVFEAEPWKGGKEKMAVAKAFTAVSLPFVLAGAATGVVSSLTGQLSIPPLVGAGTAVDLAILLAGMVVAILRIVRTKPSGAKEGSTTQQL